MRAYWASVVFLLAVGCSPVTLKDDGDTAVPEEELPDDQRDLDDDGFTADEDCDDENPDINPGADEGDDADGVDDDCNGTADDRACAEAWLDRARRCAERLRDKHHLSTVPAARPLARCVDGASSR